MELNLSWVGVVTAANHGHFPGGDCLPSRRPCLEGSRKADAAPQVTSCQGRAPQREVYNRKDIILPRFPPECFQYRHPPRHCPEWYGK